MYLFLIITRFSRYKIDRALELYSELKLYIPSEDERDVQSKYSIQKGIGKPFGAKSGGTAPWKRWTRFFQCQCGVDNTEGQNPSKKRQMPWKNVGCLSWIKLITTHNNDNGNILPNFVILHHLMRIY